MLLQLDREDNKPSGWFSDETNDIVNWYAFMTSSVMVTKCLQKSLSCIWQVWAWTKPRIVHKDLYKLMAEF